jgi:hypothetical protein
MKQTFAILFFLIIAFTAFAQTDSIREKQFHLTGKIAGKVELTPACGILAWGTVIEFEVTKLDGISYHQKMIGIIITCPEFYKDNFFETGKKYQVIFSDKNQASFGWMIPNKDLLKKYNLAFDPYAVEVKKIP